SETDYYLNRARYTLASKNVHFVKGTLLDYDGVQLAEGPWPGEAYVDAAKLEASRGMRLPLNYASARAPIVSQGIFHQHPGVSCSTDGTSATPMPADSVPGTMPTEGPLPINAPNNGPTPSTQGRDAAPMNPEMIQPDVMQTSASKPVAKKSYPVVVASYD